MAVFVDLGDEELEPPQEGQPLWKGPVDVVKPLPASAASQAGPGPATTDNPGNQPEEPQGLAVRENPNQNTMTQALGCYP